jgi:phosphate-selective porin OprO/OprP
MEQKLDTLQKQTTANMTATASTNAKIGAASSANGVYSANAPVLRAVGAYVKMPNPPPHDLQSELRRDHFAAAADAGGYDYRPNTALTSPQTAQNGVNAAAPASAWSGRLPATGITT